MHFLAEQALKNKWEIIKELYPRFSKSSLFGFISCYYTLLAYEFVFELSQSKAMVSLARAWKIKHCTINHSSFLTNCMIKKYNYSHLNITTVSHTRQNLNTYIQQSLPLRSLVDICVKRLKLSDHQYILRGLYMQVPVCSICSQ